jgi:integrase
MGVRVRQKVKGRGNPWWVFITHNGKRTSRQVGDKAAAETVASKIRAKLQLGDFDLEEKKKISIPFFKDFAKGFMGTYSAMNHKESTQESYQQALDRHILPYFGGMPLDEISRKDIKDFIAEKQRQPIAKGKGDVKKKKRLSAGTIRILKAYLSAILSEGVDDEIIGFNPAARTGKLIKSKDGKKEIFPYTWEEKCHLEKAMLQHHPRYYPLILTALRTGMRLGELIALQPGDLDFNGGFIEIRRAYSRDRLTTPKSGKSRRVDMSNGLAETLKQHLINRKKESLKKGWGEPPEWLFYSTAGTRIDINNLRKQVFYKCLEKAGLRRIRIHDLRHTYATLRISKGDNILDVSKQLGHHSVKITLDTYTHWMPGGKKSEVDELDGNQAPGTDDGRQEAEAVNGK